MQLDDTCDDLGYAPAPLRLADELEPDDDKLGDGLPPLWLGGAVLAAAFLAGAVALEILLVLVKRIGP